MKKIFLIIFLLLTSSISISCTNDEGSEDLDLLNPNDEKEMAKDSIT
ncbi:hypothetical protein GGR42_003197 [Saonia flava]|uniref:Uncharacterized protein n=1 Tax=Saonia flava TaxID=523696 RepID=A0A846QUT7_9FLAO|nr:hypothetical protein [Saonia flava]NJB72706.1 hypothetical protein [Saonia flava]